MDRAVRVCLGCPKEENAPSTRSTRWREVGKPGARMQEKREEAGGKAGRGERHFRRQCLKWTRSPGSPSKSCPALCGFSAHSLVCCLVAGPCLPVSLPCFCSIANPTLLGSNVTSARRLPLSPPGTQFENDRFDLFLGFAPVTLPQSYPSTSAQVLSRLCCESSVTYCCLLSRNTQTVPAVQL